MAIQFKKLVKMIDFQSLKPGDILAMEFHRNVYDKKGKDTRFLVQPIDMVKHNTKEVIFDKKMNQYFNYGFLFDENESTNLKEAYLISQS